jgi:hypothetical protein
LEKKYNEAVSQQSSLASQKDVVQSGNKTLKNQLGDLSEVKK